MRTLALLLIGLWAWATPAGAEDATPGSPEWESCDVEAKWMIYRRALADDPKAKGAWQQWMAREKDHDILEMIAIYDGWTETGALLADLEAPQWIRAAFWSLEDQRSHSFDHAATKLLSAHPGDVLAWAKRHPEGLTTTGRTVLAQIQKQHPDAKPNAALEALPPLRASDVFRALSAPPKLLTFGARKRAQPGEVYVHQVTRAIRARVRRLPLDETVRDQLLGLSRHPHPTVRQRSVLAFASLPAPLRPISTLYYTANDEREPIGVREAAVRVAGTTGHPALRAWLLDIAYQPAHPLWIAAVSELATLYEGFLLTDPDFAALTPMDAGRASLLHTEMKQLRSGWNSVMRKSLQKRLPSLFLQAAWMTTTGHARARAYTQWLVGVARAAREEHKVHQVLSKLSNVPGIKMPVAFAPGATHIPTAAELDNEIRVLAANALELGVPLRKER